MTYNERFFRYLTTFIFYLDAFLLGFRGIVLSSYWNLGLYMSMIAIFIYTTLFVLILLQSYSAREIILILPLLFLSFLIYINIKSTIPLYTVFFIIAAKNKDLRNLFKSNLAGVVIAYTIIIMMALCGRIKSDIDYFDNSSSLGFINQNGLAGRALYITLLIVVLCFHKLGYVSYYLLIVHALIIGNVSKSRTGLILSIFIVILSIVLRKSLWIKKLFFKYIKFTLLFIVVFCILGFIFCKINPVLLKLDEVLSGRFRWAQIYFITYGVNLFGSITDDISEVGYGHLVLDNGYAYLLVKFGIIYYLVYIFMFYFSAKELTRQKNVEGVFLILITFIGLITETSWIPINTNITLCICSVTLYLKNAEITFLQKLKRNKFVLLCFKA